MNRNDPPDPPALEKGQMRLFRKKAIDYPGSSYLDSVKSCWVGYNIRIGTFECVYNDYCPSDWKATDGRNTEIDFNIRT